MLSVLCWRNGSTTADDGSGRSSMSDSWIAWKPRIDEPSNMRPSEKTAAEKFSTGKVKWCVVPGRSVNLTSTNCTPSSLMNFRTSSAELNTLEPPWGRADTPESTARPFPPGVSTVSRVLRAVHVRPRAGREGVQDRRRRLGGRLRGGGDETGPEDDDQQGRQDHRQHGRDRVPDPPHATAPPRGAHALARRGAQAAALLLAELRHQLVEARVQVVPVRHGLHHAPKPARHGSPAGSRSRPPAVADTVDA